MILPKLISLNVCENVMKGADSNISLLTMIHSYETSSLPLIINNLSIYMYLGFGKGIFKLGLRLTAPSGTEIYKLMNPPDLYFHDPTKFNEVILKTPSLKFAEAGVYVLELTFNGELFSADYHIEIIHKISEI